MQCKFIFYLYICTSVGFNSHGKKRKVICGMTRTQLTHLAKVVFLKLKTFRKLQYQGQKQYSALREFIRTVSNDF